MAEILLIPVLALFIFYLGTIYQTDRIFKRLNIKAKMLILLLIPIYILTVYVTLGFKAGKTKTAVHRFLMDYKIAIIVLSEIIRGVSPAPENSTIIISLNIRETFLPLFSSKFKSIISDYAIA